MVLITMDWFIARNIELADSNVLQGETHADAEGMVRDAIFDNNRVSQRTF